MAITWLNFQDMNEYREMGLGRNRIVCSGIKVSHDRKKLDLLSIWKEVLVERWPHQVPQEKEKRMHE